MQNNPNQTHMRPERCCNFASQRVVYCVWVSLIGTIVAAFWVHASIVGIGLYITLILYNIVDIGGPFMIVL